MLNVIEFEAKRPIGNGLHVILYPNPKPGKKWKRIVIRPLDVTPDFQKTQQDVSEALKRANEILREADAFLKELKKLETLVEHVNFK